ncbi:MAG: phosphoribosyl-ATP diphosphatase [Parvibaculum sp.]|jgi:phosphoribosyl-ATP pyrophosphohydrolase|nr:phosphoribosyl-ATP diphosphatase [Parvibaculum sp.]|tara:strand:- start:243 stop:581 length:339 start_codon:yes stop_codon:yes gene_type:complete
MATDVHQLDALFSVISDRKGDDPKNSYTASLFAKGVSKCAQKLGEEAVETVIAAMESGSSDKKSVVSESADLIYHWLVLMAALDIDPAEVYAELARREGTSGHAEKASRKEQ